MRLDKLRLKSMRLKTMHTIIIIILYIRYFRLHFAFLLSNVWCIMHTDRLRAERKKRNDKNCIFLVN